MFKRSVDILERGRPCVHHARSKASDAHGQHCLGLVASVSAHQLLQLTRWQFKLAAMWSLRTKMQSCTVPRRTQSLHAM